MFQKNDVVEMTVEKLGMGGEGIARPDGITVFVKGGLPGERVEGKIVFTRPTFADAIILRRHNDSPDRTSPPCPVFGKCGGCALQHLSYPAQLLFKQNTVAETLKKVANLSVDVEETLPSAAAYHCRNKLSIPVRRIGDRPFAFGFFAPNSHRLVPTDACLLQPEPVSRVLEIVWDFMTRFGLTGYDENASTGDVRHIVARVLGGVVYLTVVVNRADLPHAEALNGMLREAFGNSYALWVNFNARKTNVVTGPRYEFSGGFDGPAEVDGLRLRVHPAAFFQVNDDVRKKLYEAVVSEAAGADTVVDAYSGAGVLTAHLAKGAKRVIGVELSPEATDAARRLAAENGIDNVSFVCGDCRDRLPALMADLDRPTVVLDPPRAGCAPEALAALEGAKKIIYVSCNPATLGRDLALLISLGFRLTRVKPFDMFPQTAAVETLATLVKAEG